MYRRVSRNRAFLPSELPSGANKLANTLKYAGFDLPLPRLDPVELELRLIAGFVIVVTSILLLDKLGNWLYGKGIAKPFYLWGHRLHHRTFLLSLVPTSYVVVATMINLHYLRVLWNSFWPNAEVALALIGICLAFDLAVDSLSGHVKKSSLFNHEWIYVVVPAYVFTHLLILA